MVLEQNYTGIWRLLRRLGVPEAVSEDATQEVFWIAARRWTDVRPGSERSFLYGTALRVAADARRARDVRREVVDTDAIEQALSTAPDPEELLNRRQARALLDHALDSMPTDLREVLVLFELENIEIQDIAAMLEIPIGTVGSRLRRARAEFTRVAARLRARLQGGGA